jgi:phage tail sheath protein FI
MPAADFKQRKTPGVYVTEFDAFPPSVVGVQTAVPAFIGYTERADINGKPTFMKPIKIGSLADYEQIFGGSFEDQYTIAATTPTPPDDYDFKVLQSGNWVYYELTPLASGRYLLYNALRLFFDNGGGTCYVVSVGDYTDPVVLDDFKDGLAAIADQAGPTMLVIPEAVLLDEANFGTLSQAALDQCGRLQDRVAILDVRQDDTHTTDELVAKFRAGVGSKYLSYGMGYFPYLNTSVVQASEIDYTNFDLATTGQLTLLKAILTDEAKRIYTDGTPPYTVVKAYVDAIADGQTASEVLTLNQNLVNALPLLQDIYNIIARKMNVLPASAAMAGVYTFTDQSKGVWNAPANVALTSVVSPTVKLNDAQQGDLNMPLDGKAVDVIREFVGRGSVVWGARTLDGNSNDWRYIQVRRTIIYIEQSIKKALDPFVFAPNDGNTWTKVVSMVSNFLQGVWSQGGLMGSTASEAFTVQCGLGSTMTGLDILQGYMVVQVTLQMIRPAEFIELTFKQKMEGVG